MNTSYSEKRLDIFTVTFDAFQHFSSRGFQELLPHVARQFWRRFYKYSRKAVKANCLTPLRERELLTACLTIKKAGFSPRKPLTALLAALFMNDRTRPLFYMFCGRKKASPK
ncbi:hypothetical protein [Mailhella sp.]|uniref:hypothetical protein n=1 Tax=Mailhella sp. TaxID=1981029 RepID=UPI0040647038